MNTAVVALLLTILFVPTPVAWAGPGRGGRTSELSQRAIRPEERGRAETMRVCTGCSAPRATVTRSRIAVRASAARSSKARSTTLWPSALLPLTSRAERRIGDFNETVALQQQRLQFQQQIQFELNQLRNEISRDYLFICTESPATGVACEALQGTNRATAVQISSSS